MFSLMSNDAEHLFMAFYISVKSLFESFAHLKNCVVSYGVVGILYMDWIPVFL